MIKQYIQKSERYFYLHTDVGSVSDIGINKKRFKWNIPTLKVSDCEISLHSIIDSSVTDDAQPYDAYEPLYTMRIQLPVENVFDSHYQDPILFQGVGLKVWQNVMNPPKLRLKNHVLNDVSIDVETNARQTSDATNNFMLNQMDMIFCIKISDYEPEMLEESYRPNPNQRFAADLANLNL
jgi:hypothetical protein